MARTTIIGVLFVGFVLGSARASCPIDVVIIKGRVQSAPAASSVRVRLIYPKEQSGESGETTIENGIFRIQIPFLTQSRKSVLGTGLGQKCARKPTSVDVTLLYGAAELDHVSLDMATDFKLVDPSAYQVRSDVVLHGPEKN